MDLSNRALEILLRIVADTSDLTGKVNPALDETKRKLNEVEAAGKAASDLPASLGEAIGSILGGVAAGAALFAFSQIVSAIGDAVEMSRQLDEEIKKTTESLAENVVQWSQMAAEATKAADFSKLADSMQRTLQEMTTIADQWRATELNGWQKLIDSIAALWSTIPGMGVRPMQALLERGQKEADARVRETMEHELAAIESFRDHVQEATDLKNMPAGDAVEKVNAQLAITQGIADSLERKRWIDPNALSQYIEVTKELTRLQGVHDQVAARQEKELALTKRTRDEIDSMSAKLSGDQQKIVDAAGQKAYDKVVQSFKQLGPLTQEQVALAEEQRQKAEQIAEAQLKHKSAAEGTGAAHRELRDTLAAERLQLEAIKAEMSNIESNPFLTLDTKNQALAVLIPAEIERINALIESDKQKLSGSIFDPAQQTAIEGALLRNESLVERLKIKMRETTFGGQFLSSLVQWVNQFGTLATQVGNLITSTIGTAVNGVANAISGAIFRTQSWGQAFAQVAQSIISGIIQIGLQILVSQLAGFILRQTLGAAAAAATIAEATSAAAAWAPAAALAATASYGGAAAAGQLAVEGAMLGTQAFAVALAGVGGFEGGGYTGPGGSRDFAGFVHKGEYVMPKSTVDRVGVGALDNLRSTVESGSGAGGIAIFNFTDMKQLEKAFVQSTANKKFIIQTVNGAGGHLIS